MTNDLRALKYIKRLFYKKVQVDKNVVIFWCLYSVELLINIVYKLVYNKIMHIRPIK